MHNGFVNINREKMSKSLGNFFTIREILERYEAEAVRFFLLSTHYRSPIDFSDRNLEEATKTLDRVYLLLGLVEDAGGDGEAVAGGEVEESVFALQERFRRAMDDDFNTAESLGEVFKTVRLLSGALSRGEGIGKAALETFLGTIGEIGQVLGVLDSTPQSWRERRRRREETAKSSIDASWVEEKIAGRERARRERDWVLADAIRDELQSRGVVLEDGPEGTVWLLKKA